MSLAKKPVVKKVALRARIWCFTINNPTAEEESHLSHVNFLSEIKSCVWQMEEGKNNTPHIQGVIQFKNQITFGQIKKKLPTAHLEVCKNFPASKLYCQKDDGRLNGPFIYPGPKKKLTREIISAMMKADNPFNYEELRKEIALIEKEG